MKRLFIAIDLPERIRDDISDTYHAIPATRWVDEENIHLTLRFCGESSPHREQALIGALGKIPFSPFSLSCHGAGQFPSGTQAKILWVGTNTNQALFSLQNKIEQACRNAGYMPEGRNFSPHVTVARCKSAPADRTARFIVANSLFSTEPFEIRSFHLYSSHLGKSGARYHKEASFSAEPSL